MDAAETAYDETRKNLRVARAGTYGDGVTALGEADGDAQVTHAQTTSSLDTQQTNSYLSAQSTQAEQFQTAEQSFWSTMTDAFGAFADGRNEVLRQFISDHGDANVAHSQATGDAHVGYATDGANAESTFHNAGGCADPGGGCGGGGGQGGGGSLRQAWQDAGDSYVSEISTGYVDYQTGLAEANADYDTAMAESDRDGALASWDTHATLGASLLDAELDWHMSVLDATQEHEDELLAAVTSSYQSTTLADENLASDAHELTADYLLDWGAAAKTYLQDEALKDAGGAVGDFQGTFDDAMSAASRDRDTALSDVALTHQAAHVSAAETNLTEFGESQAGLYSAVNDAGEVAEDADTSSYMDWLTQSTSDLNNRSSDEINAFNAYRTDQTATEADYRGADLSARAAASSEFSTNAGTDWAQAKSSHATEKSNWWTSHSTDFISRTADVNQQHSDFQDTINQARTDRTDSIVAALSENFGDWTDSLANLGETSSQLFDSFVERISGASGTHALAMAQAHRDYDVAMAEAQYDLDAGGSQEDYDQAVIDAVAARDAAVQAAEQAFIIDETDADGDHEEGLDAALVDHVLATNQAEIDWVSSRGVADQGLLETVEQGVTDRESGISSIDESYAQLEADSLAGRLSDLSATTGTPWAQLDAGLANARANKTESQGNARVVLTGTENNSNNTFNTVAGEQNTQHANTKTEATANKKAAVATANQAKNQRQNDAERELANNGGKPADAGPQQDNAVWLLLQSQNGWSDEETNKVRDAANRQKVSADSLLDPKARRAMLAKDKNEQLIKQKQAAEKQRMEQLLKEKQEQDAKAKLAQKAAERRNKAIEDDKKASTINHVCDALGLEPQENDRIKASDVSGSDGLVSKGHAAWSNKEYKSRPVLAITLPVGKERVYTYYLSQGTTRIRRGGIRVHDKTDTGFELINIKKETVGSKAIDEAKANPKDPENVLARKTHSAAVDRAIDSWSIDDGREEFQKFDKAISQVIGTLEVVEVVISFVPIAGSAMKTVGAATGRNSVSDAAWSITFDVFAVARFGGLSKFLSTGNKLMSKSKNLQVVRVPLQQMLGGYKNVQRIERVAARVTFVPVALKLDADARKLGEDGQTGASWALRAAYVATVLGGPSSQTNALALLKKSKTLQRLFSRVPDESCAAPLSNATTRTGMDATAKSAVRDLVEQGVPVRAAIRYVKGQQLRPKDFGYHTIASNDGLHRIWVETIQNYGKAGRNNAYTRFLDAFESGDVSYAQIDEAWNYVNKQFLKKAREAGHNLPKGTEVHHWNYNKNVFVADVFNPTHLVPISTRKGHEIVHRLTTSNPSLLWEGPILSTHQVTVIRMSRVPWSFD